jgi:glycosyltransferase involved in cell wall biosynthesis
MLESLLKTARDNFDLTNPEHQKSLYNISDSLLDISKLSPEGLYNFTNTRNTPLEFKIASKLFESRYWIRANVSPMKIGIVFAMWGEQNRLLPKSNDNPNGEDLIKTKMDQLDWALHDSYIDWELYAVDDGCPHGSGEIAIDILKKHEQGDKVKVLFLSDSLPSNSGPLKELASADDSRKGGAIILGCDEAIKNGCDAIICTDADNSVHLGQIGLLLRSYQDKGFHVVLGDRKHQDAVLVKQEDRWGVGIKLLRHMQRMVGEQIFASGIRDTQAAFKLYESGLLKNIIERPSVFDFSFDSDWIAAVIAMNKPFDKVPFAFIDSFEESASIAQGPMTTWETLLLGLVKSVRARDLPHNEEMAIVLEDEILSSKDLDLLINYLPSELENVLDTDLGNPTVMSPNDVRNWIRKRKKEE